MRNFRVSGFGFHSRVSLCASAICAGVIRSARVSRCIVARSRSANLAGRCQIVPHVREDKILRHTRALFIHRRPRNCALSEAITLVSGAKQPFNRLGTSVLAPRLVHRAKGTLNRDVLPPGIAPLGGAVIPLQGLGCVLRHAMAAFVYVSQLALRFGIALFSQSTHQPVFGCVICLVAFRRLPLRRVRPIIVLLLLWGSGCGR